MTAAAGFNAITEAVAGGRRYRLCRGDEALSFRSLIGLWADDDNFCRWYTELLLSAGPAACFWEHPPLLGPALDEAAEFVLTDAPALAGEAADARPFSAHFAAAGDADIAVFRNLGGDALLIAPCPRGPGAAYPHLAAFLRKAPAGQVRALWRETARACRRVVGAEPAWLSTSGLGVPWLHLRLDRFPKYYQYVPYKARR